MNPHPNSDTASAAAASLPRKLLTSLTSPVGTAIILALFGLYALGMVLAFDRPLSDGSRDLFLPIGLISQFVGLMCLLVMFRAMRDGRYLESFFAFFVVMPLNSVATQAALLATNGQPVTLEALARSTMYFHLQFFSPVMWIFLGALGLSLVVALIVGWCRQRTASDH
jgi:hypothetical protein